MKLAAVIPALLFSSSAVADAPPQQLRMTLTVKVGADARTHQLLVLDNGCGNVTEKSTAFEDAIDVCARNAQGVLQLHVGWSLRQGSAEYKTRWEAVAKRGSTIEVGRTGGIRLALQVH